MSFLDLGVGAVGVLGLSYLTDALHIVNFFLQLLQSALELPDSPRLLL